MDLREIGWEVVKLMLLAQNKENSVLAERLLGYQEGIFSIEYFFQLVKF
jgi:hypothetical protein